MPEYELVATMSVAHESLRPGDRVLGPGGTFWLVKRVERVHVELLTGQRRQKSHLRAICVIEDETTA
jgi:hypothetical protein